MLVEVRAGWSYKILGGTLDVAAGEAYDKVAQYLGLGFPGGPIIDEFANKGNPAAIAFPRPMLDSDNYHFSFSGIKTAVRYFAEKSKASGTLPPIQDVAASFQAAVVDVLVQKTICAAKETNAKGITLTGGVAANSQLRQSMSEAATELGVKVYFPPSNLCTDNGAMIAGVAYHQYQEGLRDGFELNASASGSIL